jgi:hypothetical protein
MKNPLPLYQVTNIYLLSFDIKSHKSATINHLHWLQGTQDAYHFHLIFYGPTSKLPLHLSGSEINTKALLLVYFFTNLLTLVEKPLHSVTSKILLDLKRLKFEPLSNYSTTQKLALSSVLQTHM